jgi:hypothetical protein
MGKLRVFELKLNSNGIPVTAGKVPIPVYFSNDSSISVSPLRLSRTSCVSICKVPPQSAATESSSPLIRSMGTAHLYRI